MVAKTPTEMLAQYWTLVDDGVTRPVVEVELHQQYISEASLPCAALVGRISDSIFYKCDLRGVSFQPGSLRNVRFQECQLFDSNFDFEEVYLVECSNSL